MGVFFKLDEVSNWLRFLCLVLEAMVLYIRNLGVLDRIFRHSLIRYVAMGEYGMIIGKIKDSGGLGCVLMLNQTSCFSFLR